MRRRFAQMGDQRRDREARAHAAQGEVHRRGVQGDRGPRRGLGRRTPYCLILMTANPGLADWEAGIEKFNEKFAPLKLSSLTSPIEFPDVYHLGLLKVGRGQ